MTLYTEVQIPSIRPLPYVSYPP
uniref:Uncharacterized protein n=1 Tax=Rhizophora mucronata TaxID=61149 RepID=A0A2P2IHN8_RHIMU